MKRTAAFSLLSPALFATAMLAPALMSAQAPPPPATAVAAQTRAFITVPAKSSERITVSTTAFANNGDIPFENTLYKSNTFPGLKWSAAPAGTKSWVIIMQDIDGSRGEAGLPILHWSMGNISAGTTELAAGMTTPPEGSTYGPNVRGANQPYMGPRTPAGPKHRYHFQVFALDTMLPVEAFATYDALISAMKNHVLASGELVGLGQIMPS